MGVSLALVFHIASALVVCFLTGWLLRVQRDLRCLRMMALWADLFGRQKMSFSTRLPVQVPALIRRFARAAGLAVNGSLRKERTYPVTVVDPRPLAQLFLRSRVSLIQFNHSTVTIRVHSGDEGLAALTPSPAMLRQSLGDAVDIVISAREGES
jgi:hypothetical protein